MTHDTSTGSWTGGLSEIYNKTLKKEKTKQKKLTRGGAGARISKHWAFRSKIFFILYFCPIKLGIHLLNKYYKQGTMLGILWERPVKKEKEKKKDM